MIRAVRRALREWRREFLTVWLRLTAFHRMVLGIVLGMLLVSGARNSVLDPLTRELNDLSKTLEGRAIPANVPEPDEDEEVLQERLRAENLRRSVEARQTELANAESGTRYVLAATHSDAEAALLVLANRHGLRVQENRAMEMDRTGFVHTSMSAYLLRGTFDSVFSFLEAFPAEPFLWALRDIRIEGVAGDSDVFGTPSPTLLFRFRLCVSNYRGGGS